MSIKQKWRGCAWRPTRCRTAFWISSMIAFGSSVLPTERGKRAMVNDDCLGTRALNLISHGVDPKSREHGHVHEPCPPRG